MKTRLLFVFMLFVAMIVDAEEVTDYGFYIEGNQINSSNYQSLSQGRAWSYDPVTNVLHLKDGTVYYKGTEDYVLAIFGDDNSSLNIQVDGDCNIRGQFRNAIRFYGNGTHTISGSGVLDINSSLTNPYCIQSSGDGVSNLTIKDITMNIRAYGEAPVGFVNQYFSSILLDHCEINIESDGVAWNGNMPNAYSVQPVLRSCFLESGYFRSGCAYSDSGEQLANLSIKRIETVSQVNITVPKPVLGTVVNYSINIDQAHVGSYHFEWFRMSDNSHMMSNGDVFEEGFTYRVEIRLNCTSRERVFADVIDVTVNGHPLKVNTDGNITDFIIYRFNHYNLMVDGVQVTWDNKDDVLGTSFDPTTNTLTLNNFYLDTQEEYEWGINNNNDMSTFDYDIDVKNLTIKLKGNNTIRTESACLYFKDVNLTIEGPGKLNLTSWGMDAINVKNSTLTLDHAKVYAKGKVSALNGTGSAMTVNNSLLEASSANETQATIRGFTSFQMTDSFFEDVYDDHDQIFYSDYMYYDNSGYYIYYDGVYGIDEGFDQSYYDNPYVGKVIISPAKSSISTNINEAYGQRDSVKGQRNERYNLSGQRVGKDYKGIVIINGKKTVVK